MRVMRSLIGSCVDMLRPSLPARLHEPGNQALGAEFTQRDAAELVLAIDRARTAGPFAAIANPGRARVARRSWVSACAGCSSRSNSSLPCLAPGFPRLRGSSRVSLPEREIECGQQ